MKTIKHITHNFKRIFFVLAIIMSFTLTAFANNSTIEKFYAFSIRDEKIITEINYYLSKGAEVKFLNTVLKDSNSAIINTMVIKIPKAVLENEPYQQKAN